MSRIKRRRMTWAQIELLTAFLDEYESEGQTIVFGDEIAPSGILRALEKRRMVEVYRDASPVAIRLTLRGLCTARAAQTYSESLPPWG